jgi:hypothetical protein
MKLCSLLSKFESSENKAYNSVSYSNHLQLQLLTSTEATERTLYTSIGERRRMQLTAVFLLTRKCPHLVSIGDMFLQGVT